MSYPTVPITAPKLPVPLPTKHQALMDIFYGHYQALAKQVSENNNKLSPGADDIFINPNVDGMMRSPTRAEIATVMPPKVNAAVILGNHHYQVGNGGWMQYDDNGYSDCIDALESLYRGAEAVGIKDAHNVVTLIEAFKQAKDDNQRNGSYRDDEDDEMFEDLDPYDGLDTAYYELDGERIMQEMLDRFEEITSHAFMAGAYRDRKAA